MPYPDSLMAATDAAGNNTYPPFPAEAQLRYDWCWAAVTTALLHWYGKPATVKQCDVVGVVLADYLAQQGALAACCPAGSNPWADVPWGVDKALQHPTYLMFRGRAPLPLNFGVEVVDELKNGRPLVVQLSPSANQVDHVVILSGYAYGTGGKNWVRVDDPLPVGVGRRTEWEFNDFLAAYPISEVFRTMPPI